MKIALAQLNYCIGDFEGNTNKMIKSALDAKGADLVVFSELSVCGYFPSDCLEYADFIEKCQQAFASRRSPLASVSTNTGQPTKSGSVFI